ncbi:unnamed protein product [Nippostrongylus brasiliensis]|uniref:Protein disulfide-isomerase n=1 Tax=Nippostrongylus brasiliensis TaxID=27835 RepID=A0A0N4YDW4_NIPBR|nr:unnamed protein product [Nippostrongylus brasiliensis]
MLRLLLGVLLVLNVGYAEEKPKEKPKEEEFEKEDGVYITNASNFDKFLEVHPTTLVMFYAKRCGHCKNLAPEYRKAATKLYRKGSPIKLAKVDATQEPKLAEQYGVAGYPTLYLMRRGRRSEYKGPRKAEGIVEYMEQEAQPAAKKLADVTAVGRFMNKYDVTIVAFLSSEDSSVFEAFTDASEMLRDDFKTIGYTTDPKAFEKYDAKPNDIIIFYPSVFHSRFEPKSRTYNKPSFTAEDLVAFLRDHCTPLVGKRTKENAATRYHKLPLVVVYYNADFSIQYREGSEYWREKVLVIANKYQKDNYHFAVADEEEFEEELGRVGLGDSGLEHNVIAFGHDGKKYPMDPNVFDGELEENLFEFMKKLSSGQIKPFIKSAPVPVNDNSPVRTLVGSNFAKVAADDSKDLLVMFYAPWCGHCKAFEPEYLQMATKLKKEEPNLIVAKFDATENDPPHAYEVQGFPTIYFAPSGKKFTPLKYDGIRTEEGLINFMNIHAVKSFQKKKKDGKKKKEEL